MASFISNDKPRGNPFTQIPSDTDINPVRLLCRDIYSVFRLSRLLVFILIPVWPWPSGRLDELYLSKPNVRDLILHIHLVITQLLLIITLPIFAALFAAFPTFVHVFFLETFWLATKTVTWLLNGPSTTQCSVGVPRNRQPVNDNNELWFFINGIATGKTWLQSNLDLLANIFQREIVGIHNPTKGLIFDILECLIQRDLDYKTGDIRQGRAQIRAAIDAPATKKVVLILHSQGGIEGASILEWLFAELSYDKMRKLEVFTFGNAARKFSNPVLSEDVDKQNIRTGHQVRVIKHIEHYANSEDFVANIGVLQFTSTAKRYAPDSTWFSGRVFERTGPGHLLNLHYLDTMFHMANGVVDEHNDFMDSKVPVPIPNSRDCIAYKPIKEVSRLWQYRDGKQPIET